MQQTVPRDYQSTRQGKNKKADNAMFKIIGAGVFRLQWLDSQVCNHLSARVCNIDDLRDNKLKIRV